MRLTLRRKALFPDEGRTWEMDGETKAVARLAASVPRTAHASIDIAGRDGSRLAFIRLPAGGPRSSAAHAPPQ